MADLKDVKRLTTQESMIQEEKELHQSDLRSLQKEADDAAQKVAQLERIEQKLDEILGLLRRDR